MFDAAPAKYPKELAHLKERLRELPAISKRAKTESNDANPEEEENSLQSQDNKETLGVKLESPENSIPVDLKPHSLPFEPRQGRTNYLREISAILDRSDVLLRGDTLDRGEELRTSKKSSASSIFSHEHSGATVPRRKSKQLKYWPNYPKYSVSEADCRKMERLFANFQAYSQEREVREELGDMVRIM